VYTFPTRHLGKGERGFILQYIRQQQSSPIKTNSFPSSDNLFDDDMDIDDEMGGDDYDDGDDDNEGDEDDD